MSRFSAVLLCALLAPCVACTSGPERDARQDLGERIAGVWLGTYEIDTPDATPTAVIITYHADGTATATSERTFGAGDPERYGLSGTGHIVWEPVGPREIHWRVLHFGYDAHGSPTYISRTHGTREFDETFESCRGTFRVEVYSPDALLDPLDPNGTRTEPLATAEGTDVSRRLHARIPDEAE